MDIGTLLFAATSLDLKGKTPSSANSSSQGTTETQFISSNKDSMFSKALQVVVSGDSKETTDLEGEVLPEENEVVVNNQVAISIMQVLAEDGAQEVQELPEEVETANTKAPVLVPEKQTENAVKALTDKANTISQELANIKQAVHVSAGKQEDTVDAKELFGSKLVVAQSQTVSFKQENVVQSFANKTSDKQMPVDGELVDEVIDDVLTKDAPKEQANNKAIDTKSIQTSELKQMATDNKFSLDDKVEVKVEQTTSNTSNIGLSNLSKESNLQRIDGPKEPVALNETKEIVDNLVEQAKLTQKPGVSEMVIRLRPQHLGDMTIRIMTESTGAVTASFHSNNPEVRAIIQEALPAIRQELSNTGLKVNDVGVYAGLNEQNFGQQHQNQGQYDQVIENTRKLSKEEKLLMEELQALHGENQNLEGGVDYRV